MFRGERARILVVDNDRMVAVTVAAALEREGYHTLTVFSGQVALDCALRFQPDCLISDVFLPGLNGFATAAQIRRLVASGKVLLLTGRAAEAGEDASVRNQGFQLVKKPVAPAELLRKVAALLQT